MIQSSRKTSMTSSKEQEHPAVPIAFSLGLRKVFYEILQDRQQTQSALTEMNSRYQTQNQNPLTEAQLVEISDKDALEEWWNFQRETDKLQTLQQNAQVYFQENHPDCEIPTVKNVLELIYPSFDLEKSRFKKFYTYLKTFILESYFLQLIKAKYNQ